LKKILFKKILPTGKKNQTSFEKKIPPPKKKSENILFIKKNKKKRNIFKKTIV
jgi:hypothetical protein